MIAHGFTVPQIVELVDAGLATESTKRVVAGFQLSNRNAEFWAGDSMTGVAQS